MTCSQRARGFHKRLFLYRQDLSTYHARVADPSSNAEGQNQIEDTWAEKCHERNCQQNPGERQEGVHQDNVEELIDIPAVVTGDRTKDQPDHQRSGNPPSAYHHEHSRSLATSKKDV